MIKAFEDERVIGIELFYTDTKGVGGKLRKNAEDFIVVETKDVLLVCRMKDEQKIRNIVNDVRIRQSGDYL